MKRKAQQRCRAFLLVTAIAAFLGTIIKRGTIKRWRTFYGSSAVLKSPRNCTMVGSSTRCVGLIDITAGNATRFGASQRSATRRCASQHIATQRLSRWGSPAARARLARTVPLKRLWLRDGHVKRNTCERRRKFTVLWRTFQSTRTRRRREQYIPLVAFCLRHFLADFIICMCESDFRQAHGPVNPGVNAKGSVSSRIRAGSRAAAANVA